MSVDENLQKCSQRVLSGALSEIGVLSRALPRVLSRVLFLLFSTERTLESTPGSTPISESTPESTLGSTLGGFPVLDSLQQVDRHSSQECNPDAIPPTKIRISWLFCVPEVSEGAFRGISFFCRLEDDAEFLGFPIQ